MKCGRSKWYLFKDIFSCSGYILCITIDICKVTTTIESIISNIIHVTADNDRG